MLRCSCEIPTVGLTTKREHRAAAPILHNVRVKDKMQTFGLDWTRLDPSPETRAGYKRLSPTLIM